MRVAVVAESFLPHVNSVTGSVVQILRHLRRGQHPAVVLAPGNPPPQVEGARVVALRSAPLPGYRNVRLSLA
jgi:phosphatidylinositol alpha 1,6-mannosyltransferase